LRADRRVADFLFVQRRQVTTFVAVDRQAEAFEVEPVFGGVHDVGLTALVRVEALRQVSATRSEVVVFGGGVRRTARSPAQTTRRLPLAAWFGVQDRGPERVRIGVLVEE